MRKCISLALNHLSFVASFARTIDHLSTNLDGLLELLQEVINCFDAFVKFECLFVLTEKLSELKP
jgi:hypothetical protein